MKKSNKLLLGGFIAPLLFITVIHISLYAKYKAGDYTAYTAEDDLTTLSMQQFPNILFVSVQNVPSATVKFSDVAQIEKDEDNGVQYVRKGDTLQISAKANPQGFRSPVTFYLPHTATFSLFNSSISFEAGKKTGQNNPVIFLKNSHAIFPGERNPLQLGHLKVVATDNSLAMFRGNTQVSHLDVQLSNSSIESMDSEFGQLTIATDSLSRIALPAKQLLKATITPTAQK